MEQNVKVDIYNYFSIALLENIGIATPEQVQIDEVENLLKKLTKLLKQQPARGAKLQRGLLIE